MSTMKLPEGKAVDSGRPMRVFIIGAGVSGIALYIRLLQHVPNATITIVEKNPELGGTWFENRYPGVACDIPSHVYQYSFEPNPRWSKLFSPGGEILQYVQRIAHKYHVDSKIKYNTKVVGAEWDESGGLWVIQTVDSTSKKPEETMTTTEAEVVISAAGILNNWKWPDVQGLDKFQGKLVHSAHWDTTWDYTNKTVALLGCGSSAIQILPHLQKKCSRVHNFIRGGTWISQPFGSTYTENILANSSEPGNYTYSEEEISRLEQDPEFYTNFRKEMESFINKDYPCLFPNTKEEIEGTAKIRENMKEKLASRPGIYEALEPSFTPGCRRLTPGPGYLEALTQGNVDLIKESIVQVTERSVITKDGKEWPVDAIACATGFDTSYKPRFPVTGKDGRSLAEIWDERASAYLSHSVPGFPNYFFVGGPNSATGGGSLLLILESVMGYVVKAVAKMSRENVKSMEVKQQALESWTNHLDKYFPGTVHVDGCTSWYKVNGKIIGLWPGSSLHAMKTLMHPRWEDYEYEKIGGEYGKGELDWIGDGWTEEDIKRGQLGYYVDFVDVPPVPSDEVLERQP